jgi:uncharacterized membrane protein
MIVGMATSKRRVNRALTTPSRLETFSDGVLAIIITIMVIQIEAPPGHTFGALKMILPQLFAYVGSFIFIAIYWNNHHQLIRVTKQISGSVMWANIHLLFWLSLIPVVTAWIGEGDNYTHTEPVVAYGFVAFMAAAAFAILVRLIQRLEPNDIVIARIGNDRKGILSNILYAIGIGAALLGLPLVGIAFYLAVSVMWFVPDRRVAMD